MAFNRGQRITTSFKPSASFGSQAVSTVNKIGAAAAAGAGIMSAIRSASLPAAGEALGDVMGALSMFGGDDAANDWRVRLTIPRWASFMTSPVLKPLKDAGGLIFPYTPTINIASGATYSPVSTIHTNYTFNAYQKSDPGEIKIEAPFLVEDATQALYWIATIHYLRSMTKMFSGADPKAGNPPPAVFLNGYGAYVFKNVPVVVSSMSVSLGNDCDYIATEVYGSAAGELAGIADSIGGLADTLGGALPQLSGVSSAVSGFAGSVSSIASLAGTFGIGGKTSGGMTHVPTKSTISITLKPVYSRNAARNFSLDRFVTGGYMNNSVGYI